MARIRSAGEGEGWRILKDDLCRAMLVDDSFMLDVGCVSSYLQVSLCKRRDIK